MTKANWVSMAFGDVTAESRTRAGNNSAFLTRPVYGVDRSVGLTRVAKYTASSLERYKRLEHGMFAYNPMRLNIGSIGFCSPDLQPGLVSPDYVVFDCSPEKLDSRFLNYYIRGPAWKEWTANAGVGSVRMRVYYRELARLAVPLPPLPEQRAIVDVLSALENKIELNHSMNATLEAVVTAAFLQWFVEHKEVGRWEVGKLRRISDISREIISPSHFADEAFNHYSIPAFDETRFPNKEPGKDIKSNKFLVPSACVMISKLNPHTQRIWLPFQIDGRSICSTEFLVNIPKGYFSPEYLYGLFCSRLFHDRFTSMITGTTGSHQRVKAEYLLEMEIQIPPEKLVVKYTEATKPLLQKVQRNVLESRTLASLRDALLPKLMSGEVRVK